MSCSATRRLRTCAAASGTVTLELAMAKVPYVVAYRVAGLTYLMARILIRVPYANLINLTADREIIPELLQTDCRSDLLCEAVERLLEGAGEAQVAATRPALEAMGLGGTAPSARAAEAVLDIIAGGRKSPAGD